MLKVLAVETQTPGAFYVVLVFTCILLSSCSGSELGINQVYASQHCAMYEAGIVQLRNQDEMSKVVQKSFALTEPEPERKLQAVDYEQINVFAIGLGTKPNSGYTLSLIDQKAAVHDGVLELPIKVSEPDASAQYAQVLVSPCIVIAVPKGNYESVSSAGMLLAL